VGTRIKDRGERCGREGLQVGLGDIFYLQAEEIKIKRKRKRKREGVILPGD
jgi:hypothetical protein